jgi:hypothetical protein
MDGLQALPLSPTGFFNRLLGRPNKKNAYVELNNLLARVSEPLEVTIENIAEIEARYNVSLIRKFRAELDGIYAGHIKACLADRKLADDEITGLVHLKTILGFNDSAAAELENQAKVELYGRCVDDALSNGQMTEEEHQFLQRLESEIQLPEDMAVSIYQEKGGALLQQVFNRAIKDRRLSPDEETELQALSKNLRINITHAEDTAQYLDKYRTLWRIENSEIPSIEPGINLQKDEKCYLSCSSQWHESRSVTRRISYGGPALRVKIAKGLYWRAGSYSVNAQKEDVLRLIDTGTLYVTSKRLIFMGARGNKVIALGKILDYESYIDGVKIHKDSGKDPLIVFSADGEIFAAVLGRAIKEHSL